MADDFKAGDRVQFTVGEEHKHSYTGYGRVTKVTHGATMIAPDNPIPMGLRMTNIKKVEDKVVRS